MSKSNYEKLEVFKVAESLSDRVWDLVNKWPPFAKNSLGSQLVRSMDSVGANIAEGMGRGTKKDHRRFIRIARGSLNESRYWLKRAYHRKLLTEEEAKELIEEARTLAPRLNAYLNSIK